MGLCGSCANNDIREAQAMSVDDDFFKHLGDDTGHMNARRRSYVERLYATLGDEKTLKVDAMVHSFDADTHPDVISGNRTAMDVRLELTESLMADGGKVTQKAFCDYYDIQSISIDSDEHFEALVRSSWINLVRQIARAKKERAAVKKAAQAAVTQPPKPASEPATAPANAAAEEKAENKGPGETTIAHTPPTGGLTGATSV